MPPDDALLALTARIVSAHWASNTVPVEALPGLIHHVHAALSAPEPADKPAATTAPTPAVPIRRSVFPDHIVCLEDGKRLKMLKRHLWSAFGMTPDQYRERWACRPTTRWWRRTTRRSAACWPGRSGWGAGVRKRHRRTRRSRSCRRCGICRSAGAAGRWRETIEPVRPSPRPNAIHTVIASAPSMIRSLRLAPCKSYYPSCRPNPRLPPPRHRQTGPAGVTIDLLEDQPAERPRGITLRPARPGLGSVGKPGLAIGADDLRVQRRPHPRLC